MFESLPASAPDKILALNAAYREDPRSHKLDLGVGIYKDESGNTPIMRSVQTAQNRLLTEQKTKAYLGLDGDRIFNHLITQTALGEDYDTDRVRTMQTPGGSGALRILADVLSTARAHAGNRTDATIWVSDPTWANHAPILKAGGLTIKTYPYFDTKTGLVRFNAMMECLKKAPEGDIILLHGCCHNPTGANLTLEQWIELSKVLVSRNLFPFVDIAYQGFGDGLEEDVAGLRYLISQVPEMTIALSCSKNFGVYCDRVGAAIILSRNSAQASLAGSLMKSTARQNYSMPPNHGAATVRMILEDQELKTGWQQELESMRTRMLDLRTALTRALRLHSNSDQFDFLATQRGMFSRLPLSPDQIDWLRSEYGIYIIGDGRINIAGLPDNGPDGGLDKLALHIVNALNINIDR
ncbi:amino acid aminotransferase [Lentilitoribacter sp. Alg239-R112]|uniref:amino acid aminotransferase n=1 Tax=Lentilitoribacter sp. Alg239-R112 TaxID=2305987 RepID=UPI0013A7050A|nr:amino acid aminotransferase [Lentilitoribacter sp. Alg239-R112]